MNAHSAELNQLAEELFDEAELVRLREVAATQPLDAAQLLTFDKAMGGSSMVALTKGGHGRYTTPDRHIFRPLQYCSMHFEAIHAGNRPEWQTRNIVMYSSFHIEALVKRIGNVLNLPLGRALYNPVAKGRIDPVVWEQISRYTRIYNASKHDFTQEMDTHLFSLQDAILAYFICRRLGATLYPLAKLSTDLTLFERDPGDVDAELGDWENLRRHFDPQEAEDST
jgi:hypothetical protein